MTTSPEFPRVPPPHIWSQIEPGVNTQLALHRPAPSNPSELTNANEAGPSVVKVTIPTVPESEEVVDAPLIRAFNLLRTWLFFLKTCVKSDGHHVSEMLSMTYQLEILYHQVRMLSCYVLYVLTHSSPVRHYSCGR